MQDSPRKAKTMSNNPLNEGPDKAAFLLWLVDMPVVLERFDSQPEVGRSHPYAAEIALPGGAK